MLFYCIVAENMCACNRDLQCARSSLGVLQAYEYGALVEWRTEWTASKPGATVRHVFHMGLL